MARLSCIATVILAGTMGLIGAGTNPSVRASHFSQQLTQQDVTARAATGLIVGRVVDAASGQSVAGVLVALSIGGAPATDANRATIPAAITGDSGAFLFAGVPSGHYAIDATKGGYADGAYGRLRPNGATETMDLADGQRVGDVTIPIWKFGSIAGTVTDESGDPVVGVNVEAMSRSVAQGRPQWWQAGLPLRTDDRGMYRVENLPPGEYLVVAVPSRDPPPPLGAKTVITEGPLDEWPPTFAPATQAMDQAARVRLASGDARGAVDIHLVATPTVRVSGRIGGPAGAATMRQVLLVPEDANDAVAITDLAQAATVAGDGTFSFASVQPGPYVIFGRPGTGRGGQGVATAAPSPADPSWWVVDPITVGDQDSDVMVPLVAGIHVSGRCVFTGSSPAPATAAMRRITIALTRTTFAANGTAMVLGGPATMTPGSVDDTGTFVTAGAPPGRYLIEALGVPPGWAFASATVDAVDISETPVELQSADLTSVVVTFTDRPAEIRGTVSNHLGGPDAAADVLMFPVDQTGWRDYGRIPRRLQLVRASTSGEYVLSNPPPGDYYLVALPDASLTEDPSDPATLQRLSAQATRVHIVAGEKTTANLQTTGS